MINQSRLQQMQDIAINKVERSALADVNQIHLDPELPEKERMEGFFSQIGNPYCFLCGDTPVKIRFVNENKPLKQSLVSYFLSLK